MSALCIMEKIKTQHLAINLDKRKDRLDGLKKEVQKIGFDKLNRFPAIEHSEGLIGCGYSHLGCVQKAKELGWDCVLILEDDVLFPEPKLLQDFVNKYYHTDFDVMFLGAHIYDGEAQSSADEIIRVLKSTCLHAYIVKSHYYDKLIANFSEGLQRKIIEKPSDVFSTYNVDVYISKVQYYDHWIAPMKCLATQKEGWSDNFNRSYDHGHFKNHFHPIFKKK